MKNQYPIGATVVVEKHGTVYGSVITDDAFVGHDGSVRVFLLGDRTSVDTKFVEVV